MKHKLLNLTRFYKQAILLVVDFCVLLSSLYLSFVLRLGDAWPADHMYPSWWLFIFIPAISIPIFIRFGLYRSVLQYIGIRVITTTFRATTISCLIIGFYIWTGDNI